MQPLHEPTVPGQTRSSHATGGVVGAFVGGAVWSVGAAVGNPVGATGLPVGTAVGTSVMSPGQKHTGSAPSGHNCAATHSVVANKMANNIAAP